MVKNAFDFKLSATKEKCRKVWTSYGINMILLHFIEDLVKVKYQILNKFSY